MKEAGSLSRQPPSTWRALILVWLCFFSSAKAADPAATGPLTQIDSLRWHHRIVLVMASPHPKEDIATLRRNASENDDRQLLWFVLEDGGVVSNYPGVIAPALRSALNSRFGADTAVLLIGKDGGVKARESRLDLEGIYARIDAMPMRIREMREGRNSR